MADSQILSRVECDFPQFTFASADSARWSPIEHKIYYGDSLSEMFHELGHASLSHKNFVQDIELLKMERDAWTKGLEIARKYERKISDDEVEDALDEYRDWLHARSLCPVCSQTGLQSRKTLVYECLNCGTKWTANDARKCGLKRRKIQK